MKNGWKRVLIEFPLYIKVHKSVIPYYHSHKSFHLNDKRDFLIHFKKFFFSLTQIIHFKIFRYIHFMDKVGFLITKVLMEISLKMRQRLKTF